MNQLKKTLFAVLGIGAAVGLGSLIPSPIHQVEVRMRANPLYHDGRSLDAVESTPVSLPTPDPFVCVCWPRPIIAAEPTPAPAKPIPEGYFHRKCKKCGQEYGVPPFCTFSPTEEEMKHFHTTPEERAQMVKLLDKWEKDPASLEKDLGLRHTAKEKP